jgi:hypothetical protein
MKPHQPPSEEGADFLQVRRTPSRVGGDAHDWRATASLQAKKPAGTTTYRGKEKKKAAPRILYAIMTSYLGFEAPSWLPGAACFMPAYSPGPGHVLQAAKLGDMRMAPQRPESARTLTFDIDDEFAWMRWIAALAWGADPREMNEALATYCSELFALLRDVSKQQAPPANLRALSDSLGVSPEDLARMPGSERYYGSFLSRPLETRRLLFRTVFQPAGDYRAVADAPGINHLLQQYRIAVQGGGTFAGALLMIVAALAKNHPDTPASLSRALAVMEGWSTRGLMNVPTERTLKEAWKKWRHLAPLWAATTVNLLSVRADGMAPYAAGLEMLQDRERFGQMLGHAKWYRSFAVSFVPPHSTAPLVPSDVAMEIAARVPEIEPDLVLPPEDLAVAKLYRAPTRKYDQ